MTKNLIRFVFVFSLLFMLLTSACSNNLTDSINDSPFSSSVEANRIDLDFDTILYYIALENDEIIYAEINEENINYIQRSSSGKSKIIGETNNFLMSMKQSAFSYPYLYFYVSRFDEDADDTCNDLLRINVQSQNVDSFVHKDNSIPGISTYIFDGKIVTIKNVLIDNMTKTYIDCFNTDTCNWSKYMECEINNSTGQGEAIYGICANQQNLFILHDICNSRTDFRSYLEVLDKEFHIVKTIEIDDSLHDYVLSSFISDMQAYEDYIYFYNASNYGLLARAENDGIKEIYKERNFEIAPNTSSNQPLFYIRRTNLVLLFNVENGSLSEIELNVKNEYTIKTILCDNDSCFIVFGADDSPDFAYLIEKEKIADYTFPCM